MLRKRVLAFAMDYLICLIPAMVVTIAAIIHFGISKDVGLAIFTGVFLFVMPFNILLNMPFTAAFTLGATAFVSFILIYILYCTVTELIFGFTFGQKLAKIRYASESMRELSKKEIPIRNALKLLFLGCFLIGLITVPFSKTHRPLYDIITKTTLK